jgi:hypothetical protein
MSTKKNYCPDGMRRNPKTGECESKKAKKTRRKKDNVNPENIIQQITNNPIVNSISSGMNRISSNVNSIVSNVVSNIGDFHPVNVNANSPDPLYNAIVNPAIATFKTNRQVIINDNSDLLEMTGQELRDTLSILMNESTGKKSSGKFNTSAKLIEEIIRLRGLLQVQGETQQPTPVPPTSVQEQPITQEPTTVPPPPVQEQPIIQEPTLEEPVPVIEDQPFVEEPTTDLLSEREGVSEEEREGASGETVGFPELLPTLDDASFNEKIALRKEFNDTKYDGKIRDIKTFSNKLCNTDFELSSHQLFVKNFLSLNTPYNSLLLYHGLGTGKTCSAIGIAEEMRSYMKQVGITHKILIIASPNVQNNFRTQFFDETKLKQENGLWSLNTCIGDALLREINPTNLTDIPKEKVISQMNAIMNHYYSFMGYTEFANYIERHTNVPEDSGVDPVKMRIKKIQKVFNNRLCIIDEVHNIRNTDDNKNKRIAMLLMEVAKHSDGLRLLLLSATPMYNNYKEIIWLVNLMNANDKRPTIKEDQVFDKEGNFIPSQTINGELVEGGRELLERKLIGYVSYVRGENPYTFPYRIYPVDFEPEHTIIVSNYPKKQMNEKEIAEPLQHIPVYASQIGEYQQKGYDFIMNNLRNRSNHKYNKTGKLITLPNFENLDAFGYTLLQIPLEALNIVYPNQNMDTMLVQETQTMDENQNNEMIDNMIGKKGLSNIMTYKTITVPHALRYEFEYSPGVVENYGRIFHREHINKYSNKISTICECIRKSTGVVMVYSQYIDGGIVPIALALEEMGFTRYGAEPYTKPLFKTPPTEAIDSATMLPRSKTTGSQFRQAKYVILSGDKHFSPNNSKDIKYISKPENKNGELVKVILISKAASEGLDFKNIRQCHVLEPWYNMNRVEQIIGRSVRNLSHCQLPFEERNVELYLHATLPRNDEEPADLYVYRLAERKAFQIGNVTRLLKQNAVDCLLNIEQTNFTIEKLNSIAENQNIQIHLSSGKTIEYKIGDRPYTDICDYMDNCAFQCSPNIDISTKPIIKNTYNTEYMKTNYHMILKRIRQLFKDQSFYRKDHLINGINIVKPYPIEQIYYTLTQMIDNKTEYLIDKYGRMGVLVNNGDYYAFQPVEITNENASIFERSVPVDFKHENIRLEIPTVVAMIQKKEETKIVKSIDDILRELDENLKIAFEKTETKFESRDTNWYKHSTLVFPDLIELFELPDDLIQKYYVYHYLDYLDYSDKNLLIQKIYSENKNENNRLENIIKGYFDEKILDYAGKKALVLANKNEYKILIQSDELLTLWNEARPTERHEINSIINEKYIIAKSTFNDIIGFMELFKDREMTFKVKDMKQKRNNKGSRCDNLGNSQIIKYLNEIIGGEPTYDIMNIKDKYTKISLCVLTEMVLRYYDETRRNGKRWFFNIEQAMIRDVSKL